MVFKNKEDNVEAKELTTEQKQQKLFENILYLAEKSKIMRVGNVRYKEIKLFLPLEIIEDINGWCLNK